jgi:transposase
MKYFIGIDNSSLDHKVHVIDENCKKLKSFIITNDLAGFQELDKYLKHYEESYIGLELPHGPVVDYLRSKNYAIYSLNPLKIKRFKESYIVSGNKNDSIDAEAIAQYILRNRGSLRALTFNSPEMEKLKLFSLAHNRLTKEHTRYKNRLLFIFRQYFPLYSVLFRDHCSKIQLKMLIEYTTLADLKKVTPEEITSFLIRNHYRNRNYIQRVLDAVQSYNHHIAHEVEETLSCEAQAIARILLVLKDERDNIEKQMKSITDTHYLGKYFKSLPGSGEVLAGKLLSLFGDNKDRFTHANGVQCLFGTAPRNYQSGSYHKVIMRKSCNKIAKNILYQYAFSSIKSSNWAREYYDSQRSKGKNHSVAVRALANKWVKIIFTIWKNETFYKDDKKTSLAA